MTSTFVRPIEIEAPDQGTLEGRASLGFKALAALNGFGVILAFFPPPVPPARLLTMTFNLASLVLVILLLIEARGIDRLRPWAIAAVRPILVVIGLAGAYVFVTTVLAGKVRIPIDVGVAIWALLAGPHVTPRPALGAKGPGAVGLAAACSGIMLFAQPLFDWGGAVDVKADALNTTMSVDCGAAAPDGTVPAVIKVTYAWTWSGSSPLPDGVDGFVVGWDGDDAEGRPLYLLEVTPDTEPGVFSGRRGHPSDDLVGEVAKESRGSWYWGIELAQRGYAAGTEVVELRRAQDTTPGAEPLTIKASYIHLGIWRQDAEPVTCTW